MIQVEQWSVNVMSTGCVPVCYSFQRYFFPEKDHYLSNMMWTGCVQWGSILTGYRKVSSGVTSRYAFQRYIYQNK